MDPAGQVGTVPGYGSSMIVWGVFCGTVWDFWVVYQPPLMQFDNVLTKYQMIKFIDFCEVWFLPESVARVIAIVGDYRCHTPRH
ncbi:hypothetical protein TNCV_1203751 [Trichonephila clavipes]|nr:hypothetical protein TNCV_1203751 [Trichonephila clavipes]